jgi:hypothetical protein
MSASPIDDLPDFDDYGEVSREKVVELARQHLRLHNAGLPTNHILLPPLARLLVIANDERQAPMIMASAARDALPYFHRRLEDVPACAIPPLGSLKDAASILAAQRRVARAIEAGTLPVSVGRDLISTLAVMLKSYEATALEDRLEQVEAELSNRRAVDGHPQLLVIDGDLSEPEAAE